MRCSPPIAPGLPAAGPYRRRRGRVTPILTELDPYTQLDAPPILLRSTWTITLPTMFVAWLRALEEAARRNRLGGRLGNVDKIT